jgi:hypothetical protein
MQTSAPTTSFGFGRRRGPPIAAGAAELTPESLVLLVRWRNFGYVWNWPIAVSVSRGGQTEHKAIVDVTRLVLWSLALAAGAMTLGFTWRPRPHSD